MSMKNKIKNLGQYFTPPEVADFMCNLIEKPIDAKILEPSAGEGVFLNSLSKSGFENIEAYEIDDELKNQSSMDIKYKNFLSLKPKETYDVVIGNPPYVRWKNIPQYIKTELKSNEYWEGKINGLSDLLYSFIYLSVDMLKINGELIFITPIFWTQTQHAKALRKFLTENGELTYFLTFSETPIFKEVSSSILIFKFIKRKSKNPIKVLNLSRQGSLDESILTEIKEILNQLNKEEYISKIYIEAYKVPQFENGNPWKPISPRIKPFLDSIENSCVEAAPIVKVEVQSNHKILKYPLSQLFEESDLDEIGINKKNSKKVKFSNKSYYLLPESDQSTLFKQKLTHPKRYIRLGDIAEIGNGMVSGLDKAFKVTKNNFIEKEKEKFLKVIKAKSLKKYFATEATNYIFVNDIEDEEVLEKDYPNIFNQLMEFKLALEKRYNYGRHIPWWEWVFLRNKKLMEENPEKILVPCKERIDRKGFIRFSYSNGNYYTTQDVAVIVKKPEFREDIKYILALLNSEIIYKWIKYKGLSRGGVVEFSERPLSIIPIRLINWENDNEIGIHNKIVELVNKILENKDGNDSKEILESYIKNLYLG